MDSQSGGHLGQDRKVPSAAGGNFSRMHKTEKTAKESRMNLMYNHLCDRTLAQAGFDGFAVTLDEFAKLFCRRERDQVARDEELIVKARGGELNFSLIFVAAKNDADRRIVIWRHHLALEIIEVEIHLSRVAMVKGADFQVKQNMAAKEAMVEY